MSSNKSSLGCLPVIAAAIALGVGGYYLSGKVLGKKLKPIEAAQVIPDETVMAGFISTDSQQWEKIAELGDAATQKIMKTQIEQWQTEFKQEWAEVNYQEDIEPWLDGAMFALLAEDLNAAQPDLLLILGVKNKLKAYNFLKKIGKDQDTTLKESKYKGVKITETTSKGNAIYSALLGHRLLVAETEQVIQQAIDTHKGEASLASSEANQKMLKQKMGTRNTLAQLYIPNYGELITRTLETDQVPIPPSLSIINTIGSTTASFGVEKQGLRLQSVTQFTTEEIGQNFSPSKGKLLKSFPGSTVAMLNGQGINQVWSQTLSHLKADPEINKSLNFTKLAVRQTTGLDLETDLFNWMDGEFAFGVVTTSQPLNRNLPINLSGGLILETTQPKQAKQTLAQLETAMQQNLRLTASQSKINKKQVTQLTSNGTKDGLNYGWLDKNKLLLTWGDDAFKAISGSKKSLAKNKNFQTLTKKISQDNSSYFYVDMPQVMKVVEQLPIARTDSESQDVITVLNSILGIGSTFTMPNQKTSQQDLFVLFKDN